jgi:hypothetical protein
MTAPGNSGTRESWTSIAAVLVSVISLMISSFFALYSNFVQVQSMQESSEANLRAACFQYVQFVLEEEAQGLADTQIDRTTDLLTTLRGQKESLTVTCGTASEIRLARERNVPLPGMDGGD